MLKKHGPVFLIYWNGMWILSGFTIYAGLTLGGIDPLPLAYAINLDRLIDLSRLDPAHGYVAAAIVLNEVAELVRFPLVVATVPAVTRWWEGARPDFMKPKLGHGELCFSLCVIKALWVRPSQVLDANRHAHHTTCLHTTDGKPKPTLTDQIRRHGPTFMVWWGTLWVAGAAGLFGVSPGTCVRGVASLIGWMDARAFRLHRRGRQERIDQNDLPFLSNHPNHTHKRPLSTSSSARASTRSPSRGASTSTSLSTSVRLRTPKPTYLHCLPPSNPFTPFTPNTTPTPTDAIPPSWGNLGVAIAFNEALEIVRFPLAVATVPYITRLWERRKGGPGPGAW